MGIEEVPIVLNERHLRRILTEYFDYDHHSRPHLSLDRNSPSPRAVEPPSQGKVIATGQVGGLHLRATGDTSPGYDDPGIAIGTHDGRRETKEGPIADPKGNR